MDNNHLNRQLIRACYEYPPDFEKMQNLVDIGADVNAYSEYSSQSMLGEVLYYYLSEITGEGIIKEDGIWGVKLCDTLCGGETVKDRDGRYLFPIVRFFFENGFDLSRTVNDNRRELLYSADVFENIKFSFCGESSMKALKYILSYVKSPEQLLDAEGLPIKDYWEFSAYTEQECFGLDNYAANIFKAIETVEKFMKEKGWDYAAD